MRQSGRHKATSLAWVAPLERASVAAGLTAGTILASYRFDRFKSRAEDDEPPVELESLALLGTEDAEEHVRTAKVAAEGANRARELQNLPGNVADPAYLAEPRGGDRRRSTRASSSRSSDRERLEGEGMGGMLAVSAGSAKDPALIVLRYSGGGDSGPTLGLVGKARDLRHRRDLDQALRRDGAR